MGVMACDRKDCESILCDNYSETFGYICSSCKLELADLKPSNLGDVRDFMNSTKPYIDKDTNDIDLDVVFERLSLY